MAAPNVRGASYPPRAGESASHKGLLVRPPGHGPPGRMPKTVEVKQLSGPGNGLPGTRVVMARAPIGPLMGRLRGVQAPEPCWRELWEWVGVRQGEDTWKITSEGPERDERQGDPDGEGES